MCRTGHPQLCDTNAKTGARQYDGTVRLHSGETDVHQMAKLGVFAEAIVAPQQACHPIPDSVPMHVAALIGCCVATGVGAVVNSPAARPGATVAVCGCGGVGLNAIQGAKLMNASRIIAVDIYDHKLEFTYKFGATDVVNSRETDPVEAIRDLTGGGVDMAFDTFGSAVTTANGSISLASDLLTVTANSDFTLNSGGDSTLRIDGLLFTQSGAWGATTSPVTLQIASKTSGGVVIVPGKRMCPLGGSI